MKFIINEKKMQVRGYFSSRARKIARTILEKNGVKHIVEFKDVQAPYALLFSRGAAETVRG